MTDFGYDEDKIIFAMTKANCSLAHIARRIPLVTITTNARNGQLGLSWDIGAIMARQEWLLGNFKTLKQLKHYYDYSLGGDTLQ